MHAPRFGSHSMRHRSRVVLNYLLTWCPIIALVVAPLEAQELGRITGTVIDATSGEPIADALVAVIGTSQRAQTNRVGEYTIAIHPGTVQLRARMLGFEPVTTPTYVVRAASSLRVDVELEPMLYEIDPVEVRGERATRASYPGARVISAEQLPRRGSIISSLKGLVPSLRVVNRREDQGVRIRGARSDVLYVIDGHVITPPLTFYIDSADVACLEIRSGYRAAHEFRPINGEMYGGVILIWTMGSSAPRPHQCA